MRDRPATAVPLLRQLETIVGTRWIVTDDEALAPWCTDWRGRHSGVPMAMVAPADEGEVQQVMRCCASAAVPVVTQGGNTGLVGGAICDGSGTQLLLSLRRLNTIRVDNETRTLLCGAGAVLEAVHAAAEREGLRFPLSLASKGSATIGGLASTNAGGTQVLRHGTMRSLVTGVHAVLADGNLLVADTGLRKDNRGFDLKQLFIGSEGTLGIITAVRLVLRPAAVARHTAWLGVDSPEQALSVLTRLQARLPDQVEAFELMPEVCVGNVVRYLAERQPPLQGDHPWHVLVEVVDEGRLLTGEALANEVEAALGALLKTGMIRDAVLAASGAQAAAFWRLRESLSAAEKAAGPALQHDIAVQPDQMPAVIRDLAKEVPAAFPGYSTRAFGHLGDGNIHLHVVPPPEAGPGWQSGVGRKISQFVYDAIVARGGTISAEHGIGAEKRELLARTADPVMLGVMRSVKQALDPDELLNPGKLVPLAPEQARP
ncbi:FAD-binding oxidoreductase [Erythrobacteraceae bacterium CFH 75059]|uniref:FAD-binding oxidoreductase n=1 Tax=Qipengyuania thermophila TaxID=2509361 RepID=UPI00102256C2|nr:FAD-binding oxidoreductase [Qipengyuania thermophila]TCD05414.1 FAD-binding oxidoreductase [Erythrobacteraceae bacterium CFH 75059]